VLLHATSKYVEINNWSHKNMSSDRMKFEIPAIIIQASGDKQRPNMVGGNMISNHVPKDIMQSLIR